MHGKTGIPVHGILVSLCRGYLYPGFDHFKGEYFRVLPDRLFLTFMAFCIFGWALESCFHTFVLDKHWVNRGFLNGPYIPIYGFGAMLVLFVLGPFRDNWYIVFPVSILVTTALEYLTSWAMEKIFNNRWWDYSPFPLNLHGRICLPFSVAWGFLCLFLVYLLDPGIHILIGLLSPTAARVATGSLMLIISLDIVVTIRATVDLNVLLQRLQQISQPFRDLRSEWSDSLQQHIGNLSFAIQEWRNEASRLNPIQRRLLEAFPALYSLKYQDSLLRLRNFLGIQKNRLIVPTRYVNQLRQQISKRLHQAFRRDT